MRQLYSGLILINTMPKIDILLATFNGELYLENQLLSLLSQTFKNWHLIIHDDGSTDKTLAILKKFETEDNRITIISDNIRCGGAAKNFLHLLNYSRSELVIFCDQDDIWFENKLALLANEFTESVTAPLAVFCNGFAYSEDQGVINQKITSTFPSNLKEQLFLNAGIQGCSLMFNRALLDKLHTSPKVNAMHDHFVTLGAICFGSLKYLDKSLMLYRQFHVNKATSNINYSISKRIASIFRSDIPVIDRLHLNATLSFYETYENDLGAAQRKLFQQYFLYTRSRLLKRLQIVFVNGFKLYNSITLLLIKTITRKAVN